MNGCDLECGCIGSLILPPLLELSWGPGSTGALVTLMHGGPWAGGSVGPWDTGTSVVDG